MSSNLVVGTQVKVILESSANYGKTGRITEVDTSRSNRHWYFIEATRCWYPDNELEVVGVSDNKSSLSRQQTLELIWGKVLGIEVTDMVTVNNPESKHHNRTFTIVEINLNRRGKPNHFYKLSNNCWYPLEELVPATGMVGKTLDNPVVSDDDDVEDGDWEDEEYDDMKDSGVIYDDEDNDDDDINTSAEEYDPPKTDLATAQEVTVNLDLLRNLVISNRRQLMYEVKMLRGMAERLESRDRELDVIAEKLVEPITFLINLKQ